MHCRLMLGQILLEGLDPWLCRDKEHVYGKLAPQAVNSTLLAEDGEAKLHNQGQEARQRLCPLEGCQAWGTLLVLPRMRPGWSRHRPTRLGISFAYPAQTVKDGFP